MKICSIGIILSILCIVGCSDSNQNKVCNVVDPIQVELGGIQYSIPASYQPRFEHEFDQKKDFFIFQQNYYKDGKKLKYRYCKQEGSKKIKGVSFDLRRNSSPHYKYYDTRDSIITANSPRFDVLDNVTSISIDNVPSSIDPKPTHPFYKDAVLSKNGLFYYKNDQNHKDRTCDQTIISVNPSIFYGKIKASCLTSIVKPNIITWRLSIAADKLGKPNGRLEVHLHSKPFEEWKPILDGVNAFIESMQDANQ